jgi:hypothetical protein
MTTEELCEEIIRLITSGEVDKVSIVGLTADDETLEPMTDAEEIIKAMGFNPNTLIEHNELTNKISWAVQSIRAAVRGDDGWKQKLTKEGLSIMTNCCE